MLRSAIAFALAFSVLVPVSLAFDGGVDVEDSRRAVPVDSARPAPAPKPPKDVTPQPTLKRRGLKLQPQPLKAPRTGVKKPRLPYVIGTPGFQRTGRLVDLFADELKRRAQRRDQARP